MKTVLFNQWFEHSQPLSESKYIDFIFLQWQQQQLGNLTFVVPTSRLKDFIYESLAKRINAQPQKGILVGLRIYSFSEFISLLYSNVFTNKNKTVVSSGVQTSLFELACEEADLQYYTNKELLKSGYIEDLSSLIFGVKEDGVTIQMFEEDCQKHFVESGIGSTIGSQRFQDVLALYSKYEELLSTNFFDATDVLNYCSYCLNPQDAFRGITSEDKEKIEEEKELYLALISSLLSTKSSQIPQVIFFDFFHFKKPEQIFLTVFSSLKIGVSICFESSSFNEELFQLSEAQIEYFSRNGFTPFTVHANTISPLEQFVAKNLGVYTKRIEPKTERNEAIVITEISNRKEEIAFVLSEIKRLTIEMNVAKDEICIVSRDIQAYSEFLREESFNAEILLNITDRFSLVQSSVVVALFSVLDIIVYGFRKRDIQRALRNPYLSFSHLVDTTFTEVNVDNFIHVADEIRFEGGFENRGILGWYQKLEAEIQFYSQKSQSIGSSELSTIFEIESMQRKLQTRKKALEDLKFIANLLPKSDEIVTLKEFTSTLESLIKTFQVVENIKKFSEEIGQRKYLNEFERNFFIIEAERDGRALKSLLKNLKELEQVYNLFYSYHKRNAKKFSELVKRFRYTLLTEKYQIREQKGNSILVTSLEQIRGIPFKYVFVLGMNQGVFPINYTTEKVLGLHLEQSERAALAQEYYVFWLLIQRVLKEETLKLHLLYSNSSEKEMLLPSMYISDLQSVLKCTQQQLSSLHTTNRITTKEQLLTIAAKNNVNNSTLNHSINSLFFSELHSNFEKIQESVYTSFELNEDITEETKKEIASLRQKAFSSSKLELYVSCPYKYMVSEIIQIKEKQEVDEFLTALNKGTIFHNTLDVFFKHLLQNEPTFDANNIAFVKMRPENYEAYSQLLHTIGEKVIEEYTLDHPYFSFSKEYFLGSINENEEHIYGLFDQWLQAELEFLREGWDFYPYFFELEFGSLSSSVVDESKQTNSPLYISDKTTIKGKIDRIEMRLSADGTYEAIIADYKLNSKNLTDLKKILEGKKFQLPLYARAFEIYFEKNYLHLCEVKGGVYYAFGTSKNKDKIQSLQKVYCFVEENLIVNPLKKAIIPSVKELLDTVVSTVELTVSSIAESHFEVRPDALQCARCSFSKICRFKEAI